MVIIPTGMHLLIWLSISEKLAIMHHAISWFKLSSKRENQVFKIQVDLLLLLRNQIALLSFWDCIYLPSLFTFLVIILPLAHSFDSMTSFRPPFFFFLPFQRRISDENSMISKMMYKVENFLINIDFWWTWCVKNHKIKEAMI